MEPLDVPTVEHSVDFPTEDGYIYGRAPKPPGAVPDVEGMMAAVGIPGPPEGGLPFSLEWYAGAKDRKIARDAETEKLLLVKAELRQDWASLVSADLMQWGSKVDRILHEPSPVNELAELYARAVHENPHDIGRNEVLRKRLAEADSTSERLQTWLGRTHINLTKSRELILANASDEKAEEANRLETKKVDDARRAKAERALQRNEALIRGEVLPESDEENTNTPTSAANEAFAPQRRSSGASPGAFNPSSAFSPAPPQAPAFIPVPPMPSLGPRLIAGSPSQPARSASFSSLPEPTGRSGLGRELPPLADPPALPPAPATAPTRAPAREGRQPSPP